MINLGWVEDRRLEGEESNMSVGSYILLGCVFVGGFVLGGIIVYAWNARRWHQGDLEEILARVARIDSNVGKVHSNFRIGISRFGEFADKIESDVAVMRDKTDATNRVARMQAEDLEKQSDAIADVKAATDGLSTQLNEVGLNTERVLERVKLLS